VEHHRNRRDPNQRCHYRRDQLRMSYPYSLFRHAGALRRGADRHHHDHQRNQCGQERIEPYDDSSLARQRSDHHRSADASHGRQKQAANLAERPYDRACGGNWLLVHGT